MTECGVRPSSTCTRSTPPSSAARMARALCFMPPVSEPASMRRSRSAPEGELVRQLTVADLTRRLAAGAVTGGMKHKAHAILRAIEGGVERVHVLDGRQPHTVIAELFTDRGVGSLVQKG